jgi:7-cyano-7-deazaguanine synthase
MCAVIGALIWSASPSAVKGANAVIDYIFKASIERGRDGWGYHVHEEPAATTGQNYERKSIERATSPTTDDYFDPFRLLDSAVMIGNTRAEPTTEFVEEKREYDQQPYRAGKWNVVHNGTIANDKELREFCARKFVALPTTVDSAAIAELLAAEDRPHDNFGCGHYFALQVARLKGSYAILATHDDHPDTIFAACNYRPIWYAAATNGCFFASSRDYFPSLLVPQMLEPYSTWMFTPLSKDRLDVPHRVTQRALVVCSGGMDSVVAAACVKANGCDVTLLHFRYGSRAEGPEQEAIRNIAEAMGVDVVFRNMAIYGQDDSPLLRADDHIAGGEAGAEFAYEWVPARNLVMLSLATAYAEAHGFDTLVLGNNLEEAGAYPDNEPEFIARFNDMLPFAIGDGKKLKVIMPVGNLMKHEIVALGHELEAPLHLTWSCYRAGEKHCGTCGPCYMRRTAFRINGLPEVISYEGD